MTKQISTTAQLTYNDENLSKSTMSTLNEIVGFHYYTTRTVFECEGREVVFVNECMLGFVSIYILNGIAALTKDYRLKNDLQRAL